MVQKLQQNAFEFSSDIANNALLMEEISAFKKRNIIVKSQFCTKCLNAHIIKKAPDCGLSKSDCKKLIIGMNSEIGHDGYYLDENDLIKI